MLKLRINLCIRTSAIFTHQHQHHFAFSLLSRSVFSLSAQKPSDGSNKFTLKQDWKVSLQESYAVFQSDILMVINRNVQFAKI